MRRKLSLVLFLSLAGMALAGCSDLSGRWASKALEPQMARKEYEFLGKGMPDTEFTRAVVYLHDDGTYSAEVYYGENLRQSTGKWEKNADKLTLVDSRGDAYSYRIQITDGGKELKLVSVIRGTDVVLVMQHENHSGT